MTVSECESRSEVAALGDQALAESLRSVPQPPPGGDPLRQQVEGLAKALKADHVIVGFYGGQDTISSCAFWSSGKIVPNITYTLRGTPWNRGAECFVILGDPNARTFRASVILKVSVPLQLRF